MNAIRRSTARIAVCAAAALVTGIVTANSPVHVSHTVRITASNHECPDSMVWDGARCI